MSAPKFVEQIPAVSGPVKLPKLTPNVVRDQAGAITGAVFGVLAIVLMCIGIAVSL